MRNDTTKSRMNRRTVLIAMAGAAPLMVLASTDAQAKLAQATVGYQADPKDGKQCSDCNFYIDPGACKQVDGTISPTGYCKLFNKKAS
jgi:hypothetical protein